MRIDYPGALPIRFELPYEADRIDRTHRYAIRARIKDGDRVLFATTEAVLVITQGHPNSADLSLARVADPAPAAKPDAVMRSSGPSAAAPVLAPLSALPPPALTGLPATFTGTLPCGDCAGLRYQLTLFPDDAFFVKTTRTGRGAAAPEDDLGSWVLSSDRRVLVIKGTSGPPQFFSIRDAQTLRKLDAAGRDARMPAIADLHRTPAAAPLDVRVTMTGVFKAAGSSAAFTECSTGETWAVTTDSTDSAVLDKYRNAARRPGDPVLLSLTGHLISHPRADRVGSGPTLVPDRVISATRLGRCDPRFAGAPLEGTTWVLSRLGDQPIAPQAGARTVPSLSFRAEPRTFAGSATCSRVTGSYEVLGDAISFTPAGTLKSCTAGKDADAAFRAALIGARTYRILGRLLDLYDAKGQDLARFDAKQPGNF
jgi:copper homeostasis protein (lipoprotein)